MTPAKAGLTHSPFLTTPKSYCLPDRVVQPPNVAEYGRGEEAALIEQWLRARGFVIVGSVADDENNQPFMAVA